MIKGFISIFYTPNCVSECPLCGAACAASYFAHLLSPCPALPDIVYGEAGDAFVRLVS